MTEPNPKPNRGGNYTSSWSPFKNAVDELREMLKQYEDMLRIFDFSNRNDRTLIVQTAKNLTYKSIIPTDIEAKNKLMSYVNSLGMRNDMLTRLEQQRSNNQFKSIQGQEQLMKLEIDTFKATANTFLDTLYEKLKLYELDIKMNKDVDWIEKLCLSLNVFPEFKNLYGIPISPQMELLARVCYMRTLNGLDNVIPIQGDTGSGKTTWAFAFSTTYALHMSKLGFDLKKNLVINEPKEYVTGLLSKLEPGQLLWMDEAGNQANRKLWYQTESIEFMNYLTRLRKRNLTIPIIWPDLDQLDPGIIKRAAFTVTINVRGLAEIKGLNRNRFAKEKIFIPTAGKNKIALTGEEASDISEKFDPTKLMTVPYYEIPAALWNKYDARKEDSLSVGSLRKMFKPDKATGASIIADEQYMGFLLSIPIDALEITAIQAKEWSIEHGGYYLSFIKITKIIADRIGKKWRDIIRLRNDQPNADEYGYIVVDDYVRSYLQTLKGMQKNTEEAF